LNTIWSAVRFFPLRQSYSHERVAHVESEFRPTTIIGESSLRALVAVQIDRQYLGSVIRRLHLPPALQAEETSIPADQPFVESRYAQASGAYFGRRRNIVLPMSRCRLVEVVACHSAYPSLEEGMASPAFRSRDSIGKRSLAKADAGC
jgi:hypothetical protein